MVLFPAKPRNSRIQGNPVHPGTESGLAPETRPGFPELYDDFLKHIFPVARIPTVDMTDFVDQSFVIVHPFKEIFFRMISVHHASLNSFVGAKVKLLQLGIVCIAMRPNTNRRLN